MRTMTIGEYILEKLNERLAGRGENVRLVAERPRPRAVEGGNVVSFGSRKDEGIQC